MKKATVKQSCVTICGVNNTIISREFTVKEGFASASVRIDSCFKSRVTFNGDNLNAEEIDSVIAVLKAAKKMLKLTLKKTEDLSPTIDGDVSEILF